MKLEPKTQSLLSLKFKPNKNVNCTQVKLTTKIVEVIMSVSMIETGTLLLSESEASETVSGDTSTFHDVTFPTPFPEGSKVVVLAQTQTFNGRDTPGIRLADINETGFKIRFNELVGMGQPLSDGPHNEETVGWVAYSES